MSPRRNWDSPTPRLASDCAPPSGTKGRGHTRLRVRCPNSDERRKSLALCLLCGVDAAGVPICKMWRWRGGGGCDAWWPHPSLMVDGEIYNLIIPPLDICYLNVLTDTHNWLYNCPYFPRRIVILHRITVRCVPDRDVPESFPWTMLLLVGQYVLCTKRPDPRGWIG
jgi:hypothetical protein